MTDTYEGRDLEALASLSRYYARIMEGFQPYLHGHAVEFGSGRGTVSNYLLPHVSAIDLVEPSPNLFSLLKEEMTNRDGVSLYGETLESYLERAEPESRDTTVMVNVLEHIEDDALALRQIHQMLKPGGHLLIFVPALRFLYSEFDRLVGHHRRYHRKELAQLATDNGYEVITSEYCDVLGILPWLVMNRWLGFTSLSPRLAKLYDTIGTPTSTLIEKVFRPPFGKNVLMVARRPE
jgi:SAM-dependent methyltransferase